MSRKDYVIYLCNKKHWSRIVRSRGSHGISSLKTFSAIFLKAYVTVKFLANKN